MAQSRDVGLGESAAWRFYKADPCSTRGGRFNFCKKIHPSNARALPTTNPAHGLVPGARTCRPFEANTLPCRCVASTYSAMKISLFSPPKPSVATPFNQVQHPSRRHPQPCRLLVRRRLLRPRLALPLQRKSATYKSGQATELEAKRAAPHARSTCAPPGRLPGVPAEPSEGAGPSAGAASEAVANGGASHQRSAEQTSTGQEPGAPAHR